MPTFTTEDRNRIEHHIRWTSTDPMYAYEEAATQFYKDTGFMAPGKDMPAAFGGGADYDESRQGAWRVWLAERTQATALSMSNALEAMEEYGRKDAELEQKLAATEEMAHNNLKGAYAEGIEKAAAVVHSRAQNTRTSVDAGSANARVSELALTLALNEILALIPKEKT